MKSPTPSPISDQAAGEPIGYLSAAGKNQLKSGPWVKLYRDPNFPANIPVFLSTAPTTGSGAVATLHDDGYYTFHGEKPHGFNYQGWRMDVYAAPASPAARVPVPWENLPCYLIDKCEGQVISEEFLQRALSEMLADPQYSGARPFELSQEFISKAKDGPDVMGSCADSRPVVLTDLQKLLIKRIENAIALLAASMGGDKS